MEEEEKEETEKKAGKEAHHVGETRVKAGKRKEVSSSDKEGEDHDGPSFGYDYRRAHFHHYQQQRSTKYEEQTEPQSLVVAKAGAGSSKEESMASSSSNSPNDTTSTTNSNSSSSSEGSPPDAGSDPKGDASGSSNDLRSMGPWKKRYREKPEMGSSKDGEGHPVKKAKANEEGNEAAGDSGLGVSSGEEDSGRSTGSDGREDERRAEKKVAAKATEKANFEGIGNKAS